ncbi:MAG: TPR-repeat-containing protein, partial [bacterium]
MPGIGKTAVALTLGHKVASNYRLYLDLKGIEGQSFSPTQVMSHVIQAFHPNFSLSDPKNDILNIYRSLLHDKKVVLLLDNVVDAKQIEPLIPPTKSSILIITSRQYFTLRGGLHKKLDILQPQYARELLASIVSHISTDIADQICYFCGYLPMAICIAGNLLANTIDLRPDKYVIMLSNERDRLKHLGTDDPNLSVEASFNLSYQTLTVESAKVFRFLAVFPGSFDAMAAEAVCNDKEHKGLSELVKRNLVLYDKSAERYYLHDLMRLFAISKFIDNEQNIAQQIHAFYYFQVLVTANLYYQKGRNNSLIGLRLFDREWINIRTGHEWAITHLRDDSRVTQLCTEYCAYGEPIYQLRLLPTVRVTLLQRALVAASILKDPDMESTHLGNLGIAYSDLGKITIAIDHYKKSLEIQKKIGDRQGESSSLVVLGQAYARSGNLQEAINCYENALVISCETKHRKNEANARGSLGLAYQDLGNSILAQKYLEEALLISIELGDIRGQAVGLCSLSSIYIHNNLIGRAIKCCSQGIEICEKIDDQVGKSYILGALANAYMILGDLGKASDCYNQSLVLARENNDLRAEATNLCNLGEISKQARDNQQAIEYYNLGLLILNRIEDKLGKENVLSSLGEIYEEKDDLPLAIEFLEKSLDIARDVNNVNK